MNRSDFVDAVREDNDTALSRLGSSKALYALTEGEMDEDVVLARAADRSYHAAETFDEWGADDAFADAAETQRDHYRTIADELADHEPDARSAMYDAVADQSARTARLGALVGWAVVADATYGQLTGYFTGQADPQTASTFRAFRGDVEDVRDAALADLAETGGWDDAKAAADAVVQAAYDEYFETLEALGVNPKPVC